MIGVISRVFLGIELAVLVLLAGGLSVVTAYGVMGISNLVTVLYFAASCVVCLALVAAADIAFRRIKGGEAEVPEYGFRIGIAFGGAAIATGLTIYSRLFLSDNDRWVQGLDFIGLGCFLWVPVLHLTALEIADRAAKRCQS